MRTISQAVEGIIQESPFLAETMAEGVANHSKIARRIKPEVEKRLLETVSESAVAMALHRLSANPRTTPYGMEFLKQLDDITVRSNLVELVFPNTADISRVEEHVFKIAKEKKDAFLNFSRGLRESLLIINQEFEEEFLGVLKNEKNLRRTNGLSAITMHLPESSLNVSGLYYPILKTIAWEGISFVEVMSIDTEFSIIFNDRDIDRAFSALKRITS